MKGPAQLKRYIKRLLFPEPPPPPPPPRKPVKVFCVGLNRTATTSMGRAFDALGYKTWHWNTHSAEFLTMWHEGRFPSDLERAVEDHDAFEDLPWGLLYRELDERFPGSKFVLTVRRSPEAWLRSIQSHISGRRRWVGDFLVYGSYDPVGDASKYLDIYRAHNDAVERYFADRPGALLRFCPETGSGWADLCAHLEIDDVPQIPFPHANATNTTQAPAFDVASHIPPLQPLR